MELSTYVTSPFTHQLGIAQKRATLITGAMIIFTNSCVSVDFGLETIGQQALLSGRCQLPLWPLNKNNVKSCSKHHQQPNDNHHSPAFVKEDIGHLNML